LTLRAGDFCARRVLRRTSRRCVYGRRFPRHRAAWAQPGATAMLNWYRALRHDPARCRRPASGAAAVIWGERDAFLDRGPPRPASPCAIGADLSSRRREPLVAARNADRVNRLLLDFLT
jgi:hypothetical protein